jgi:hypothetical protein
MAAVEITFVVLWLLWGFIGIVRGYPKELGVTTMLLFALGAVEFLNERYATRADQLLGFFVGADPTTQLATRVFLAVLFLSVIAFISYQGATLVFPGQAGKAFLDWLSGLLNGYLYVGSVWYYLNLAGFPVIGPIGPTDAFYNTVINWLPPAVFSWPILIGLGIFLLIVRVWK